MSHEDIKASVFSQGFDAIETALLAIRDRKKRRIAQRYFRSLDPAAQTSLLVNIVNQISGSQYEPEEFQYRPQETGFKEELGKLGLSDEEVEAVLQALAQFAIAPAKSV